jgi:adenylate cyclase
MPLRPRLTLGQLFALSLAGLTLALGVLLSLVLDGWRRSLVSSSESLRDAHSQRIGALVEDSLYEAQRCLEDLETRIRHGALDPGDRASVEAGLFAAVLANPQLSEVTLTRGRQLGFDEDGDIRLASEGGWQLSVVRLPGAADAPLVTRYTFLERGAYARDLRRREPGVRLDAAPLRRQDGIVDDPTEHATFRTTTSRRFHGQVLWTDLHYSELDSHLPEPDQRVVVTVMKAVADESGRFAGVLRVGRLTQQLDALVQRESRENAPHTVFLCDERGGLLTRTGASDRLADVNGDLRVVPALLPPELAAALAHPALARVAPGALRQGGPLDVGGRRYLVTFRGLGRTQGWRVGILVPEDHYLGALIEARNRLIALSAATLVVVSLVGAVSLRAVRRGLGRIDAAAARIRDFEFAEAPASSSFRDVASVLESLELAKTALRALGRYVPVALVRHLYKTRREPVLGGELAVVSLMFTDIQDFTALSERSTPDELAGALGLYLEAMTGAIHGSQGIVDKYVGDAVMALWNAAAPCPEPATHACRAAVACIESTRALYASAAWKGWPPLATRFGLHKDRVMVGHFGAPDRMSFTAIGDGVNLASRLEGLNKQYGTTVIASEAVYDEAKEEFAFRLLDVVAVKGKTRGVRIYELLGPAEQDGARTEAARRYEAAFAAYQARDFAGAVARLEGSDDDAPSRVLLDRCRKLIDQPPSDDWDGTHIATSK